MDKDGGPGCPFFFTNSGTARVWFLPALFGLLCSLLVSPSPSGARPDATQWLHGKYLGGRRPTCARFLRFLSAPGSWDAEAALAWQLHQAGENIRPQPTGPFSSVAFLHGVQPTTTRMTCGLYSTQRRFTCREENEMPWSSHEGIGHAGVQQP